MLSKVETWSVPRGIRYLSEWKEFNFNKLPDKCILNKQIPGCGFTEYCIRSSEWTILCSPRKILLQNKTDQHKGDVYLVINELEKIATTDKDLSATPRAPLILPDISEDEKKRVYLRIKTEIRAYLDNTFSALKAPKILTTYDSFGIVFNVLKEYGLEQKFHVVVDEMQSILGDAAFKSSTELRFLKYLGRSKRVYFVSATPMLEEYIDMLEEFNNLPYINLDWGKEDPCRIIKPDLKVLSMRAISSKINEVIQSYLNGKFEKTYKKDKETNEVVEVESRECVIYVNSVNHILSAIKKNNLAPDQVNILCATSEENLRRMNRRLGRRYSIGSVPLKGEKHKMFTFCTRTVYLGADFYSKCARSFVFSDAKLNTLAVDIAEDLPQIMGRQRSDENPWKNCATLYFKPIGKKGKLTQEELDEELARKDTATSQAFSLYAKGDSQEQLNFARILEGNAGAFNYKDNYVAVNDIDGRLQPVINNLVRVNEVRSFRIQQIDYRDRFTVFATVADRIYKNDPQVSRYLIEFENLQNLSTYYDRMKYLCSLSKNSIEVILNYLSDSDVLKSHYLVLGKDKIRAAGYNITRCNSEVEKRIRSSSKFTEIQNKFKVGEMYSCTYIRAILSTILESSVSATEVEKYFEVKPCKIPTVENGVKKRVNGFKIIKKL